MEDFIHGKSDLPVVVKQELAKILYPSTDVSFDPVADRPAVPLRRIQSLVSSLMSRHMAWNFFQGLRAYSHTHQQPALGPPRRKRGDTLTPSIT